MATKAVPSRLLLRYRASFLYYDMLRRIRVTPCLMCRLPVFLFFLFCFVFLSSGGWGKIKLKLTTLPRIFIRVVCRFNWYIRSACTRYLVSITRSEPSYRYVFCRVFDFFKYLLVISPFCVLGQTCTQDALAENPEMLVDYVRIYTLEGQSVFVAEPPEQDSSSGGGGSVVSVVTAVSVLVVLGVLFSLCLVRECNKYML